MLFPAAAADRVGREAKGPTTLKVNPEGNHVCADISYKVRPLMADWMAAQLGAGPSGNFRGRETA